MKIGLLKCDTVAPDLLHLSGDYSDMFRSLFSAHAPHVEIVVYDVTRGEYPKSLDEVSGYLTTGSRNSVYDEEPWILRLKDFVRTAYTAGKKFIGVCFGHQMIAHALGGQVAPSVRGWGAGVKEVSIVKRMPWMEPPLTSYDLMVVHQDQVEVLPPGAVLLGKNSHCPHSLYQVGSHFLSMQAHPEFEAIFVEHLLRYRLKRIGTEAVDEALQTLTRPLHRREIVRWMLNFLWDGAAVSSK
jgi:GMP synthase-like glutamine amidotransferase